MGLKTFGIKENGSLKKGKKETTNKHDNSFSRDSAAHVE